MPIREARKAHRCASGVGHEIPAGELYLAWDWRPWDEYGPCDGTYGTLRFCLRHAELDRYLSGRDKDEIIRRLRSAGAPPAPQTPDTETTTHE